MVYKKTELIEYLNTYLFNWIYNNSCNLQSSYKEVKEVFNLQESNSRTLHNTQQSQTLFYLVCSILLRSRLLIKVIAMYEYIVISSWIL